MNGDAWDDICINPHEDNLVEGRREGHEAGLKKGYNDGLDLGAAKGVEFGMEIGFIRKSCQLLAARDSNQVGQFASKIDDLIKLLEDFPRPDALFREEGKEKLDLQNEMQRIRAKFKVLTTQLKMPQYSLKRALNETTAIDKSTEW